MQQFDWFDGLLPESIPVERKAALLRGVVLAGAYLYAAGSFSYKVA